MSFCNGLICIIINLQSTKLPIAEECQYTHQTPLFCAAIDGHANVVEFLLNKGAKFQPIFDNDFMVIIVLKYYQYI